ncbi:MAG: metallophosphatase family protein [Desulforhopalus sp.]|nr:metallophosphatase family protein [Desulforhopalus sp.]
MRLAVLSDIHGNLEAFYRCLNDIELSGVDRIVNLGDSIGYGPQPEEVLNLLKKRGIPNILGNHELAAIDINFRLWLTPRTLESIKHTLKYLSSSSLLYIKNLPTCSVVEGALLVHGCPPDSPTMYLNQMSLSEIRETFESNKFIIAFAGHTHRLMLIRYDGKDLAFIPLSNDTIVLEQGYRYIVNVGSVGQPRDDDPRAKYVIWDNSLNTIEIRRISYDIDKTAATIMKRGFQRRDADRLFLGESKQTEK